MLGINLDKPILFKYSSLRFFAENERYVNRLCEDDVLLLVYEGVLRFTEDGVKYEVHPGEYHIHKQQSLQFGDVPSDSPKYLYVHFLGEWSEGADMLAQRGTFDVSKAWPIMEELDKISHARSLYIHKFSLFCELLMMIYPKKGEASMADKIAAFISENLTEITLDMICEKFNFSKNHIINIFKKQYGITPVKYINNLRIDRAKYFLEVTSDTIENIAYKSGFKDYSYFYKQFLEHTGFYPSKWRAEKQTKTSVW